MSQVIQLYPHAVSAALKLRLTEFDDPTSPGPVDVLDVGDSSDSSSSANAYDAYSSHSNWERLSFKLTASLAPTEIARILRPTSSLSEDTALTVQVTCPATKLRHGIGLDLKEPGAWEAYSSVQRSDLRGLVILRPQLIRVTGIPVDDQTVFATKAGSVIAFGDAVTLYVDQPPKSVSSSAFNISWEDFSNSDHPWRRDHYNDVFHLDPFAGEPRLYLNSKYRQLREVIESDAKRGPEAGLRDIIATMIAQPVLLQLSVAALTGLELDEDLQSAHDPVGWRADLLASVLPRLFPEEPVPEQRLLRAAHEIRETDGAASLLSRLGSVVQEMVGTYKTLETIVRAFESVVEREDIDHD